MAKQPNNPPFMKGRGVTKPSSYQRETNLIDLPIDIIINILNRLPNDSLFLFQFACRLWRALLHTPKISRHIKHISDLKYTLMKSCDCSYRRSDVTCRFKIPIELNSLEFFLLEPVNGILCIIGRILSHITFVYLWNPLTTEFKPNVQMGHVAIGFGFVPNTIDYKVVRVIKHERKSDTRVEIYSLNRNSWKRVEDSCSSSDSTNSEITVNESEGGNFWNSRSHACKDRFCDGVVTVDLENEVITETESRYASHPEGEHRRKHCRTITWTDQGDAILLTLPEDDLVLRPCYRSPTAFTFTGSLVSLNRDHHDNLG